MRNTIGPRLSLAAIGILSLASSSGAVAQNGDDFDRTPQQCIDVRSIDKTAILDDQTIVFFLRGKRIYTNYLPYKCFGLKSQDRFSYRVNIGRLCSSDTITVLELSVFNSPFDSFGGKFRDGATCPLGAFQPITADEAADLTRKPKDRDTRKKVEATVVELPPAQDAAPAAAPSAPPTEPAAPADDAGDKQN